MRGSFWHKSGKPPTDPRPQTVEHELGFDHPPLTCAAVSLGPRQELLQRLADHGRRARPEAGMRAHPRDQGTGSLTVNTVAGRAQAHARTD